MAAGRRDREHQVIDVERRSSPSCSPRRANDRGSNSSGDGENAADDPGQRPESASLLPPRRPTTFDGVTVSAAPPSSAEATPSKRHRSNGSGDGGGSVGGRTKSLKPAWADGALHLTTAVVGVGILGLPRALVDLGWATGVLVMAVATVVSLYTALLLVVLCTEGSSPPSPSPPPTRQPPPSSSSSSSSAAATVGRRAGSNPDLHRLAEQQGGKKKERAEGGAATSTTIPVARPPPLPSPPPPREAIRSYGALARATLGPSMGDLVSAMQLGACFGLAVTYCVTGGASLASFFPRFGTEALWSLAFGLAQFPVAVLAPDLERLAGVSAGGALASGLYASAAVAASARALLMPESERGGGDAVDARERTVWSSLDAVSTILFAFGGHFVLPEIAAASSSSSSPPSSPSSPPTMVPAVKASYVAVAVSYFSVAASGAAAFGSGVADDVLLSRGAGPRALVALANAAVCFHVAAGFHVFSQPCYTTFEGWFRARRKAAEAPESPASLDSTATAARACYVTLVAAAAAALPFFSVCMALVGALAFAPATFVLPPAFAFFSTSASTKVRKRRALHGAMAAVFGVLSVACAVSATRGLAIAVGKRVGGG